MQEGGAMPHSISGDRYALSVQRGKHFLKYWHSVRFPMDHFLSQDYTVVRHIALKICKYLFNFITPLHYNTFL